MRFRPVFGPRWSSFSVFDPNGAAEWKRAVDLRRGSIIIASGRPCKVKEYKAWPYQYKQHKPTRFGAGMPMSAYKTCVTSVDIFTSEIFQEIRPGPLYFEVPFVERNEFTLSTLDPCSGVVVILDASGMPHAGLKLPMHIQPMQASEDDRRVTQEIIDAHLDGNEVKVIVLSACGTEKIVGCRVLSCRSAEP